MPQFHNSSIAIGDAVAVSSVASSAKYRLRLPNELLWELAKCFVRIELTATCKYCAVKGFELGPMDVALGVYVHQISQKIVHNLNKKFPMDQMESRIQELEGYLSANSVLERGWFSLDEQSKEKMSEMSIELKNLKSQKKVNDDLARLLMDSQLSPLVDGFFGPTKTEPVAEGPSNASSTYSRRIIFNAQQTITLKEYFEKQGNDPIYVVIAEEIATELNKLGGTAVQPQQVQNWFYNERKRRKAGDSKQQVKKRKQAD